MAIQVITKEDLNQFKLELLNDLKQIFKFQKQEPMKQWLKSYEVRDMLGISRGTLQNLRTKGTLSPVRIGGLMFYAYTDILKLMKPPQK
jgi:hypothetical protein